MSSTLLFYGAAVLLGLALGMLFVGLWRLCVPRGATGKVVSELSAIAKEMARNDEIDQFFALYKRLILSAGGYVGRNIGGLLLACLPMGLVLTLLAPTALEAWGRATDKLAVYATGSTVPYSLGLSDQAGYEIVLNIGDSVVPIKALKGRTAICTTGLDCLPFDLLAFDVVEDPTLNLAEAPFIVVRPDHDDSNPLWPFLSDLELVFFLAFMIGTIGAFLVPKRRPVAAPGLQK